MQLLQLRARDFRNLEDFCLEPHPRVNVVAGENGQGKTNLLEAIHLAVCQRPFRAQRTVEMIRFGAESSAVRAVVRQGQIDHDIKVSLEQNSRRVALDGKALRGVAGWPRGLTAVLFTPDDLSVPKGAPSERRRLLDRAVTVVWPAYAELVRSYTRSLSSRNRLLREQSAGMEQLLDVYDEQLARLGAKIVIARARYVRALSPEFESAFNRLVDAEAPALAYRTELPGELEDAAPGELAERFLALLRSKRREDLARRSTSVGPHHDDLEFELAQRSARTFASQGQIRALVLAFRMAQIADTYQRFGHYPLLLLDDVSSELDPKRNEYLFDFINQNSFQLFVTTTRPELIPDVGNATYFTVIKGQITQ